MGHNDDYDEEQCPNCGEHSETCRFVDDDCEWIWHCSFCDYDWHIIDQDCKDISLEGIEFVDWEAFLGDLGIWDGGDSDN